MFAVEEGLLCFVFARVRLIPILCAHCVCLAHCQCTSATCSCVLSRSSQQPVT